MKALAIAPIKAKISFPKQEERNISFDGLGADPTDILLSCATIKIAN